MIKIISFEHNVFLRNVREKRYKNGNYTSLREFKIVMLKYMKMYMSVFDRMKYSKANM